MDALYGTMSPQNPDTGSGGEDTETGKGTSVRQKGGIK